MHRQCFVINEVIEEKENFFDRQQRISWWRQDLIESASVMVVGAGALGNEALKNLALLGFRNFFICDFDQIERSNLSRTVLFRSTDVGQRKAETAARRLRELTLAENPRIDWFDGDIVWELGLGVFRRMNIVLGCLDNIEARLAVNRACRLVGVPWIDAGIHELALHVSVFGANNGPCYECSISPTQRQTERQRYSCYGFKKAYFEQSKVATVQVAASLAAALQVQEAIKILCGDSGGYGKTIFFQGRVNDFDVLRIPQAEVCRAHMRLPSITTLEASADMRLGEFLELASQLVGASVELDLSAERAFVVRAPCWRCHTAVEVMRPSFAVVEGDVICGRDECRPAISPLPLPETVGRFSHMNSDPRILDFTLRELGVPHLHVVPVRSLNGEEVYVELSRDWHRIAPRLAAEV